MQKTETHYLSENRIGLSFVEGPFKGIIFTYGAVSIDEDPINDSAILSFDYTLVSEEPENLDVHEFKIALGDHLSALLLEQLSKNDVVYTGGTDTNDDPD